MKISRYFRDQYQQVLDREPEMLTKARIRILAQAILAFIFLFSLMFIYSAVANWGTLIAVRLGIFLLLFISAFVLFLFKQPWTLAGHLFLACFTILIWSGALLSRQGVTLVTVQYTLLIITGGYYILGARWGLIYSLANLFPVIVLVITEYLFDYHFPTQQITTKPYAFVFVLVFNFVLLVFIHYHFFRAFRKTNKQEQLLKADLQAALAEAQELAAAKTNFLSTMSHELRTPLNAVIGMTNILAFENKQPEQKENLDILRFSAENLMAIINDILDFNKMDAGQIQLEKNDFKLDDLLKNVYGAFRSKAASKNVDFFYLPDPELLSLTVTGDQGRLTQILFNLVENALKYTPAGYVRLQARVGSKTQDQVRILFRVEDSGIGIPQDRQENIFDPFVQVLTKTSRQYHGTGLGLTIVSRLVALHGDVLTFASEEGQGTTFSFGLSFPIVHHKILPNAVSAPSEKTIDTLRVLIAEDNAINVLVLKKILKNWNILPDVAFNGQEAVEACQQKEYDVVLMDINMPVMDGFEAAKLIKEATPPGKMPVRIMAVTASVSAADEQLGGHRYLDDYMLKPFNPELLKEKLLILCQP
ncbi:response regulator [Mucilaginibacter sp. HMF5004]|uniref:hybrid sensor histidine kinase/response regulator n=1 Tax=Mucilaginibacter rivuli TaxID=2857527 RepID=UPI001C5FD7C5|nr:ATP-binding protein [Mucilaginibacter rivuli]MBW4888992.1 response regulator [Mucilaginibacter rivuli]